MPVDSLILTLDLDDASFARFDAERRAYFTARLDLIPAHVTLFHHLPGEALASIADLLEQTAGATAAFEVAVTGLRTLGRGTAYDLRADALSVLRANLAGRWSGWLTPQDRQGFRPHLTIQNKVSPEEARALHARLSAGFEPFVVRAEGLRLWRYLGGPWEAAGLYPFATEAGAARSARP